MREYQRIRRNADAVGIGAWASFVAFCFSAVAAAIYLLAGERSGAWKWMVGFLALGIVLVLLRNVMLIRARMEERHELHELTRREDEEKIAC